MERFSQLAVQAPNRQGILAEICRELADAKVNIIAIQVPETNGSGTLRIVPDDVEAARGVFDRLGHAYAVESVLGLRLPNQPGALARVAETLGIEKIGIEFLYCTTDVRGRAERVILAATDSDRAFELLSSQGGF